MKLRQYIDKIDSLKKEIKDCGNLIELYTDKQKQLQQEYLKLMDIDLNLENDNIEDNQHLEILKEAIQYYRLYRCPKCGHYSMPDYVCHNCGCDRSEIKEDNIE